MTTLSTHEHPHRSEGHTHRPDEQVPGPSEGAVFVEVGEGVGAAVIRTGPDLDGAELEIRPATEAWSGVHTAVRERRFAGQVQYAAVFGSLPEGTWELRVRGSVDPRPVLAIDVSGGSVVEERWPGGG